MLESVLANVVSLPTWGGIFGSRTSWVGLAGALVGRAATASGQESVPAERSTLTGLQESEQRQQHSSDANCCSLQQRRRLR